ncbi:MAG: N-acetyl-alpha-D-glucosaminyl L-malate synthase BshA [Acidobacteria bacterium]|nr:N-acetyl-alpha-D-glucosaminyl L-malate synthase BshA [Acidobacteriota bacterium]
MTVGMVCYASVGGSGIVATELAKALAMRGHSVHVVSSEAPFRLGGYQAGLSFHRVHSPAYPLFREPQYLLSLATKIVQLAREHHLDIVHAHYAIPHATAAYLARQILADTCHDTVPRVITTLHGTDITIVGSDASYSETVAFSIEQSDGVTAVSQSLKEETYRALEIDSDIRVIPNFLDCDTHRRVEVPELRRRFLENGRFEKLVTHISNFRPVKRIERVVEIFRLIRERVPAKLLLIGEGPEVGGAARRVHEAGLGDAVEMLGEQDEVVALLSISDLFLLPSSQESFGLAALEAMASGVPVVASRVGGLPEVIDDGLTGFLHPPDALRAMADSGVRLLTDPELHQRVSRAARRVVERRFCADRIVPLYEAYYEEVRGRKDSRVTIRQ